MNSLYLQLLLSSLPRWTKWVNEWEGSEPHPLITQLYILLFILWFHLKCIGAFTAHYGYSLTIECIPVMHFGIKWAYSIMSTMVLNTKWLPHWNNSLYKGVEEISDTDRVWDLCASSGTKCIKKKEKRKKREITFKNGFQKTLPIFFFLWHVALKNSCYFIEIRHFGCRIAIGKC